MIMTATVKNQLSNLFKRAWVLVKKYGFSLSAALRQAWQIAKLQTAMKDGIVNFLYKKIDGTMRTAWGTLQAKYMPVTGENRRTNETLCTYFDTEKGEFRCFKIANFIQIL